MNYGLFQIEVKNWVWVFVLKSFKVK